MIKEIADPERFNSEFCCKARVRPQSIERIDRINLYPRIIGLKLRLVMHCRLSSDNVLCSFQMSMNDRSVVMSEPSGLTMEFDIIQSLLLTKMLDVSMYSLFFK